MSWNMQYISFFKKNSLKFLLCFRSFRRSMKKYCENIFLSPSFCLLTKRWSQYIEQETFCLLKCRSKLL